MEQGYQSQKVSSWRAFSSELKSIFGDPNCHGQTLEKILSLKMSESQHVHCYTVSFKEYADELRWPKPVLHNLYYCGLPDCIKDLWACTDPPTSLTDLIAKAQHADICYWKCVDEKKKAATTTKPTEPKSICTTISNKLFSKFSSHSSSRSDDKSSSKSAKDTKSSNKVKDLSNILSPDGKLLPEEKACHKKNGLCMYCAEKHMTNKCPLKPTGSLLKDKDTVKSNKNNSTSPSKTKAHIAQVVSSSADSNSSSNNLEDSTSKVDF